MIRLKLRLRTQFVSTLYFFVLALSGISFSATAEITLRAGISKKDISPDPRIKNWVTGKPYTHLNDPLYLRTLLLHDGKNKTAIVTLDIVDAGESLTHEIRKSVSSALSIPYDHILVNASHSHSAPWAPVYTEGFRGKERDTWWAIRYMPSQNNDPHFSQWMQLILAQAVAAARDADATLRPVTLWITKTDASEFMNNRRPVKPAWGIEEQQTPKGYSYMHKDWDPDVLTGGAGFGPMDRTLTLLSLRDNNNQNIATIFHAAIHAVSVYPFSQEISADWPGEACQKIQSVLGGEVMFLQGTAGDINPWRRGREAVTAMGSGLAAKAQHAMKFAARLQSDSLIVKRSVAGLPLDTKGRERTGLEAVHAEVQVIALGSVAIVTLPGEPLTDLGQAIRDRSPFPQTLVLGYSNGNGVHYMGMPDDMKKGGYEMELGTVGTAEAGTILVEMAVRLLHETVNNSNQVLTKSNP